MKSLDEVLGLWKKDASEIIQNPSIFSEFEIKRGKRILRLIAALEYASDTIHGEFCGSDKCHPCHDKLLAILEGV